MLRRLSKPFAAKLCQINRPNLLHAAQPSKWSLCLHRLLKMKIDAAITTDLTYLFFYFDSEWKELAILTLIY